MTLEELIYIDETGFHYPDYPTILEWLQNKYKDIFGDDIYLESDSQDGQWLAIEAQAMYDSAVVAASTYNSFSPSSAQGVALARNVKINGIRKRVATKSTVDVKVGGTVGTVITNGIGEDTLKQKWLLPSSVTIGVTGFTTVTATAENEGAITTGVGTITKIFTPTQGWQTITNEGSVTEGVAVENDANLRVRQSESVAIPSLSVLEGTKGSVANLDGVVRSIIYENDTGATDSDGIPAHSIAAVVEGGDVDEIASAIALHKTSGTRTYGDVSVETFDRYGMPNVINFFRPTDVPIKVEITIDVFEGYTTGYDTLIKTAVAALINSLKIGQDVLITKIYVPANLPGTTPGDTFDISSLEIARVGDSLGDVNLVIDFDEAASCSVDNINVVVS